MQPDERDVLLLRQIIEQCEKIERYQAAFGSDFQIFAGNPDYRDLCALAIIQIGECSHRLSIEFKELHPDIAWRALYGMRCMLTHDYLRVDDTVFWNTVQNDIPGVKDFCRRFC